MSSGTPLARSRSGTPRRTPRGKKGGAFGADPAVLIDDLISRVGGAVLDAMDALEVSAREAGVSPQVAAKATESSTAKLRTSLGARLACLRAYALRNVFAPPPNGDEAVLDKQISVCTSRLADARAKTRQVEAAQRALQRRITALDEAHAAKPNTLITDAERKVEAVNATAIELLKELDDTADALPPDNEAVRKLPPKNSVAGHYAREFGKQREASDESSGARDEMDSLVVFDSVFVNQ